MSVSVSVTAELAVQRGDNELWRHSRLRWLDSTAGEGAVGTSAAHGAAHRSRGDVWEPIRLDASSLSVAASGRPRDLRRRVFSASSASTHSAAPL